MRPVAPFRLSLLHTSLGLRPRPMSILPFQGRPHLSSLFSTHPSRHQQQSYFRRLDSRIAETFGIGRNMRIMLYVILGAASSVETWFYCFWTWQWWKRRAGHKGEDEVEA
ncbi:hypothetical protein MSAN_01970200 [Mycena sanguinolenta]|uniref:Uncharacterized protein n=1 Tax=Mycena sanguinolenta TaxID=230812 RepID=A0A8H6XN38_9AGAR|nr:hypothetical protein MSAN_01970200 [Mycena sanguinolenta]